jgi:hypothetical protein
MEVTVVLVVVHGIFTNLVTAAALLLRSDAHIVAAMLYRCFLKECTASLTHTWYDDMT